MGFDEAGDVAEVFDCLARPSPWGSPGLDLAGERVFKCRHSEENPMDIGGDRPGGEIAIEVFRAQLQVDLGAAEEVHRPVVSLSLESDRFEHVHSLGSLVNRDDKIDIPGHHRLGGPVVHGNATDGALMQFGAFQGIDHLHDVVGPACCLPVVKLSSCHGSEFTQSRRQVEKQEKAVTMGCV